MEVGRQNPATRLGGVNARGLMDGPLAYCPPLPQALPAGMDQRQPLNSRPARGKGDAACPSLAVEAPPLRVPVAARELLTGHGLTQVCVVAQVLLAWTRNPLQILSAPPLSCPPPDLHPSNCLPSLRPPPSGRDVNESYRRLSIPEKYPSWGVSAKAPEVPARVFTFTHGCLGGHLLVRGRHPPQQRTRELQTPPGHGSFPSRCSGPRDDGNPI